MTINIKLNVWLWLLCGRSTGFKSDLLNTGIAYGTPQANPDVVAARNLLHLNDARTDFHVLGALAAALEIAQALRVLPEDHSTVFDPSLYHEPVAAYVTGATPAPPASKRWPSLRNFPRALPAATSFTVTRDGALAVVTSDAGTRESHAFQLFGATILIPGLQGIGIDAAFVVPSWNNADTFTINVPPTRYPFAAVAASITDPTLIALMSNAGVLEVFATTNDPVRRVGALACAIMLEQYRRSISSMPIDVVAVGGEIFDFDAAAFVNDQLSIDWRPIFAESSPVTYDDNNYDPDYDA